MKLQYHTREFALLALLMLGLSSLAIPCVADELPEPNTEVKVRVTGLFSPERIPDLHGATLRNPELKLVDVDYPTSVVTFKYASESEMFRGAKPEQVIERLHNLLGNSSRYTFGARELCPLPRDKLTFLEIPVAGLDCKACCLGAYDAVYRLEGVEQATASFRDGLVTAWIDATKTDRVKLEKALQDRGVTLQKP